MKYMLLTYLDENAWANLTDAQRQKAMDDCGPHVQSIIASGKFLGGAPLHPTSMATTVRAPHGKRVVTDGPFAETREQLGGYTLIEAKDLDEAIAIAAGFVEINSVLPCTIEVRPIVEIALPSH